MNWFDIDYFDAATAPWRCCRISRATRVGPACDKCGRRSSTNPTGAGNYHTELEVQSGGGFILLGAAACNPHGSGKPKSAFIPISESTSNWAFAMRSSLPKIVCKAKAGGSWISAAGTVSIPLMDGGGTPQYSSGWASGTGRLKTA